MQSQLKAQLDEEQAQKKAKDQLTLLRERHEAILKIESDIVEVNKIFKDLTTMVHQQGDIIDSISANVEQAQIRVELAKKEVAKDRQYQAKARKKKCFWLVALMIALVVISLIIYFSIKG